MIGLVIGFIFGSLGVQVDPIPAQQHVPVQQVPAHGNLINFHFVDAYGLQLDANGNPVDPQAAAQAALQAQIANFNIFPGQPQGQQDRPLRRRK